MTKYWGPLGWATLHSVAALYPDQPTAAEQALANTWLESFAYCITCPTCQNHFQKTIAQYRSKVPNLFSSRREFVLFVLRAHNTVNRRIGKKVYTLAESWAELRRWLPSTGAAKSKRNEYIQYSRIDWGRQTNLSGISALMRVRDLSMTEQQYWGVRELNWDSVESLISAETDISMPIVVDQRASTIMPTIQIRPQRFNSRPAAPTGIFSLISR